MCIYFGVIKPYRNSFTAVLRLFCCWVLNTMLCHKQFDMNTASSVNECVA